MINFTNEADRELLAELKESGLVNPIVLEAIHRRGDEDETPSLDDFLLQGADLIDEKEWLVWMIRRHGCYRFGPVRLAVDPRMGEPDYIRERPNLPYLLLPVPREGPRKCLVGVLRPDLPADGLRAAATLKELKQLRADWARV